MILAESFSASLHNLDQVCCIKNKNTVGSDRVNVSSFSSGNLTESRRLQNPCFSLKASLVHTGWICEVNWLLIHYLRERCWSFLIMNNQCFSVWNCEVCTVKDDKNMYTLLFRFGGSIYIYIYIYLNEYFYSARMHWSKYIYITILNQRFS